MTRDRLVRYVIPDGSECDNCGETLEQDIDGEAGCCLFCGAPLPDVWRKA